MTDDRLLAAKHEFGRLLARLFRLDCADLDFGIYRILALRRAELERFLDRELLPQVEGILAAAAGDEAEVEALAGEVFADLTRFFSRYYDEGELLPRRRYDADSYALPHDGGEVQLHWASADQHYVKTAERHADYTATIDGLRLRFRLAAAEADRDNNKSREQRRYILRAAEPVEVGDSELTAWFEYRVPEPGSGRQPSQRALCKAAEQTILAALPSAWRTALTAKAPQSPRKYTVLGYQLYRYTKKNTSDYFIHKDLGGFLRRELDGFCKAELLRLDELEDRGLARLEVALRKLRAIRAVGHAIIAWLAQREDLQKRLYLEHKLVLRTDWLVSLSLLPDPLREAIAACPAQRAQWRAMYGAVEQVDAGYVADTSVLDPKLRLRVMAELGNLDAACSGEVIRGDNLHALRLLAPRLAGAVQVTYVDPPYNTGSDGFMYRDAYQHSSWLTMLRDRLAASRVLASPDGTITVSIDDAEMHRARELLDGVWGPELAKLVWDRNRKNDARFFSVGHEYMLVHAVDVNHLIDSGVVLREPKEGLDEARAVYRRLCRDHGDDWDTIRAQWLAWFDDIPLADPRRRMRRYGKVGPRGPYRDDGNINWPGGGGPRYEILHPVTGKPCKLPRSGWRFPSAKRFWEEVANGRIVFGPDETTVPAIVSYLFESGGQVMPSVFYSYAQTAAQEFDAMFGARVFDNPKSWRDLARVIRYLGRDDAVILDYFAGSGSTGHAVLSLNRLDGGRRSFVLVEMGEHGDTVLLPRLQKAAYCDEWQDGRPKSRDPIAMLVKVTRLESYDDTLENVALPRDQGGADHALRYSLEAGGALLGLERVRKPWNYTIKVRRDGVVRDSPVDLVETFNYLLGLRALRYDTLGHEGLLIVTGIDRERRRVAVLWRDCDLWPDDRFADACTQALESLGPDQPELVYVNGDGQLASLSTAANSWTVERIEARFQARMFDTTDRD